MIRGVLLAVALLLPGCVAEGPPAVAARAQPTLFYVGLGLYDETWSFGDVAAGAAAVVRGAEGFRVEPILFSYGADHRYPPPSRANIDRLLARIGERAQPGDVVMLYLSTHGAPGLLAREADGQDLEPATIEEVREWLAPLRTQQTVLILSACFSGSFIPALAAENRVILAAARSDRTSFGCRAGADHTIFGAALLDALTPRRTSLQSVVRTVRAEVSARERDLAITQPSDPQLFVGGSVRGLYEAPIF